MLGGGVGCGGSHWNFASDWRSKHPCKRWCELGSSPDLLVLIIPMWLCVQGCCVTYHVIHRQHVAVVGYSLGSTFLHWLVACTHTMCELHHVQRLPQNPLQCRFGWFPFDPGPNLISPRLMFLNTCVRSSHSLGKNCMAKFVSLAVSRFPTETRTLSFASRLNSLW